MKLSELSVLLPCHSLEDFPTYYEGPEADQLLAAWCSLWHPALLAAAGALPVFQRVDIPPEALADRLLSIPPFCLERLPAGYLARAESEAAGVIRAASRDEGVAAAAGIVPDATVAAELAADFISLGFARLQIELLTRQMRYSVQIDETHCRNTAVGAAEAALRGDEEAARAQLAQCFETLHEARMRFYPVDVHLIDLTLLAPTTLGPALEQSLAAATPTNLLATAGLLQAMHVEHPATWSRVLASIDAATACVLGGEEEERCLPLLPLESALASLLSGARQYERLLGRLPQVYGRRRAGLWPGVPQILVKLGYQGALHFTLDDGRFPLSPQSKTRWEGLDSSTLDAYCRVPYDAAKASTFLSLARNMADSMDNDHVAGLAFAHWPGAISPWYEELRRIARQSPVLGKFTLLDDYFAHTDMPGRLSKFEPDQYRTPYLKQAIVRRETDSISSLVRAHAEQAAQATAQTIATLSDLVRGHAAPRENTAACDVGQALVEFAAALSPPGPDGGPSKLLVVNPLSFSRRIGLELPAEVGLPAKGGAVVAAGSDRGRNFAVIEVPALGFTWIEPQLKPGGASRDKTIGVDNKLTNEFLEVTVSRTTGGIQALYDYGRRGNQLSQQLAMRLPEIDAEPGTPWAAAEPDAGYTTMRAENVQISANCPAFGEITSHGKLVDAEGRALASFRQRVQVWAGSRVLRLELELDELAELRADPWNSYYAARFAWPDELADLARGLGLARHATTSGRLEAPEYIDIESTGGRTTILTGGLPYHRRAGARMLDSLLIVRGETARRFQMGIGVGLAQPAAAAMELITPSASRLAPAGGSASGGWFFHVDAKNVVATHWQPLFAAGTAQSSGAAGECLVKGFRARLLETAGRAGRVTLRTFRPVAQARQVDFLGQTLVTAPAEGDRLSLDFAANEWIEVEAMWAD
ncbi:MAG: hypothetical protein AB7O59_11770 [Pirellulales bacterium]